MKLITHNMITSSFIKGVTRGFPLGISASEVKVQEVEFNPDFVKRMLPKLDWTALCSAAESIGHLGDLPKEIPADFEANDEFLKKAHHVLQEIEIKEGELICPESNRKFTIKNGIPNMLLNEDEV